MGQRKFLPFVIASVLSLALLPVVVDDVFAGNNFNLINGPLADLGDFKCYTFDPVTTDFIVDLDDQFDPPELNVDIIELFKLCTFVQKDAGDDFPASLNLNDIDFPNQHFMVYRINEPAVQVIVDLTDQFTFPSSQRHMVLEPVELWVPAAKNRIECPPNFIYNFAADECKDTMENLECPSLPAPFTSPPYSIDPDDFLCTGPPDKTFFNQNTDFHYKCYNISPQPFTKTNPVVLHDQFEDQFIFGDTVNLLGSDKLCVPVVKTVVQGPRIGQTFGTQDADHLKCYPIDTPDSIHAIFELFDQFIFGLKFDDFLLEDELCVIVDKQVVPDSAVGGTLIPIDTTALLLTSSQMTAAWLIPAIAAGIGFPIVIARKS